MCLALPNHPTMCCIVPVTNVGHTQVNVIHQTHLNARLGGWCYQEVALRSCLFEGDGLSSCVAGEAATFNIQACDSRGSALGSGAAAFALTVSVDGTDTLGACSFTPCPSVTQSHTAACLTHVTSGIKPSRR